MNTIDSDIKTTPLRRRLAFVAIAGALALSFAAAVAALGAENNVTSDGIFTSVGDYITAVSEALGAG